MMKIAGSGSGSADLLFVVTFCDCEQRQNIIAITYIYVDALRFLLILVKIYLFGLRISRQKLQGRLLKGGAARKRREEERFKGTVL
jgi:hypothetical protein